MAKHTAANKGSKAARAANTPGNAPSVPATGTTPPATPPHPAVAALMAAGVVAVALVAMGKAASAVGLGAAVGRKVVGQYNLTLANGTVVAVAQANATGSVNLHTCGLGNKQGNTLAGGPNGLVVSGGPNAAVLTAFCTALAACGYQYATAQGKAANTAPPQATPTGMRVYGAHGTLAAALAPLGTMPTPLAWQAQGKGNAAPAPTAT